jgi:hypothetical protein
MTGQRDCLVLGQKFLPSFLQSIDKKLPQYLREKRILSMFVLLRCSLIQLFPLQVTVPGFLSQFALAEPNVRNDLGQR